MPEWFGPDCSPRHCPSGDDPLTFVNELTASTRQHQEVNGGAETNGSMEICATLTVPIEECATIKLALAAASRDTTGTTAPSLALREAPASVEIVPKDQFEMRPP